MKWLVLITIVGVATAETLFFRPYQRKIQEKVKENDSLGLKKAGYFYTSRKTALELMPKVTEEIVLCPSNKSACPPGNTCCLISAPQTYGCCPLPQATCCLDKKHCCPHNTKCDEVKGQCIQGRIAISWLEKTEAIPLNSGDILRSKEDSVKTGNDLGAVICPDGLHMCQDGQTCCKNDNGYACCPFNNAVCCSDEIHCCPENTKCNLAKSKCDGSDGIMEMLLKEKAVIRPTEILSVPGLKNVQCPDKQSSCLDGQTCCLLPSGQYGCCPLPQAVCCDDHIHCCPKGTTCLVSKGQCQRGQFYTDWFTKSPAISVRNVPCPGGTTSCPDGNTCCQMLSGEYGCCPLPEAVCCTDHVHCCPKDYTCDLSKSTCNKGNLHIDWFLKSPADQVNNVVCPDPKYSCPDGNTCCQLASGEYGCCPLPKAVCCSDHLHCCPHGETCDVSQGKCIKGDVVSDWFLKIPAKSVKLGQLPGSEPNPVQCNASVECPTGNTCCKLTSGQWGCCPLPQAVCCSDHLHCCPHGETCDVSQGKCIKGDVVSDWFLKTPAKSISSDHLPGSEPNPVQCNASVECPTGNTCCKLTSGQWGCCPLPQAVCCSDHLHCCPNGETCDVSQGKCIKGDVVSDWFLKTPAKSISSDHLPGSGPNPVQCNASVECPTGNTCCKLTSGQWGCCPLPQAVCCSDHLHCCPHGETCDVSHGKCIKGDGVSDWFLKTPAKSISSDHLPGSGPNPVQCNASVECPTGNTCCKLTSGQWGCCPLPQAVCCSDHLHCCPHGETCDVSQGKCIKGDVVSDWFLKTPAKSISSHHLPDSGPNPVQCNASVECPTGNTCCKLTSGQWGCCPLPQAVCCSDHLHCCPNGETCDVSQGKCIKGDVVSDWFLKTPAKSISSHHLPGSGPNPVQCNASVECPTGNTCCKLTSGQWGCCPLPQAVCCSDHLHCCPHGETCDVSQGKCIKGDVVSDWFLKTPAKSISSHHLPGSGPNPVQCNASVECPTGNTCCKLTSGQWGCCPLPQAVCCSDHLHCCPHGETCDVSQGKCIKGDVVSDWFLKTPAKSISSHHLPGSGPNPVQCNASVECPTGNTCCKLTSGQWGCCPLPQAVCCSDHLHCCPNGETCDVSQGKCIKGDVVSDWFLKTPAKSISSHHLPGSEPNPVQCNATVECPTGNTCCKLTSGQWGCCPLPQAVCCSDHLHCCPHGETCDVSQGKCIKGDVVSDWFLKTPAKSISSHHLPGSGPNPVQCNATVECPTGNTCCKLTSGQWGCCPLPQAVCCSDHLHCCPNGETCDVSQGKCIKGDVVSDWFLKTPAKSISSHHLPGSEPNPVQCNATVECPTGNTCCKLTSGQWGCCPLPQAVCCSDHLHCCPHGETCDVSQGKCIKGDVVSDWFLKTPAKSISLDHLLGSGPNPVQCNATVECPTGNTCCKLTSGQWGCCPLPQAVCCSDHLHCCPHGETCDVSQGKCIKGDVVSDWFLKTPAKVIDKVICPGGQSECKDGDTCCKTPKGDFACCPLPNAVCCDDRQHCCPHNTKCDKSGQCISNDLETEILSTLPARPVSKLVGDVVCPDGSECLDGQTCCKMYTEKGNIAEKEYGCCPLPNAVCCADNKHCCPHGFVCNLERQDCEKKGWVQVPWFHMDKKHKTPDTASQDTNTNDVICPGGKQKCPSMNTCCDDGSGGYKCCSENNAVCCKDHKHCCPHGYICDEQPGICRIPEASALSSIFLQKISSKQTYP